MDSYLEIARAVLRNARQPLSARQILRAAHQLQLVPRDLYGRTQHKTLQARLATDILKHRSKSEFYRTGPGRFFLRIFQSDRSISRRLRHEYQAPLRAAQLGRFDVVAFPVEVITALASTVSSPFSVKKLFPLPWRFARLYNLRRDAKLVPFRFLLLLVANGRIFLDNRKPMQLYGDLQSQSAIGIEGFVKRGDLSLFSSDDFGLTDAATRTLLEQFELPHHMLSVLEDESRWSKAQTVIDCRPEIRTDFMVYLSFQCAGIAEITDAIESRLTTEWLPIPFKQNDVERFDIWSARLVGDPELQAQLCG